MNFWPGCPEHQELVQVPGPLYQLSGNGGMNRNSLSSDILKNSFVRCWLTPDIVLWLQAIDRDNHVHVRESGPSGGKHPEGTCHDLYMDAAGQQQRNHDLQLAVAYEGISTKDRKVQRPQAVNHLHNPVHQLL